MLIECESPVTSTHHATHSALLALVVVPPSLFFFVLVCFLGGLEAVNSGQVHSPLAAYLVSFCYGSTVGIDYTSNEDDVSRR